MINALTDFIKTLWYKIFILLESKAIEIVEYYTGLTANNNWKIYPCAVFQESAGHGYKRPLCCFVQNGQVAVL